MKMFSREELLAKWVASKSLPDLSNYLRANTLTLIQEARSGHVGSSFSVMDIVVAVHAFEQGEAFPRGQQSSYRIFSSKGHDAPAFYAVNHFLGLIEDGGMKLRRLGFLPGHPEIGTGGTISNTGSLGMGISKAKGFAAADHLAGKLTTTYVVLGDGELQEGQIWESIADPSKVLGNVIAIVDGNGIQSDTWVCKTRDLGDVRARVEACGWNYLEVDGHDFEQIRNSLLEAKSNSGPTMIWARTVKGHGSTELTAFPEDGLFYHAHSGAVSEALAGKIHSELLGGPTESKTDWPDYSQSPKMNSSTLPNAWAKILLDLTTERDDVVVMDGDLALDTGTYSVAGKIGNRYMQMGIAEQDMVSMAGSISLGGYTPIVHSFATFLTMRPFEQIVNNASEGSRVIYCGFLAGIVPSAAGFSHQAVLDLSIMSSVPGMLVFEPATLSELSSALSHALDHKGPSYLRMNSVPPVDLAGISETDRTKLGTRFGAGQKYTILCSGAFSLQNALNAQAKLEAEGISGQVRTYANKSAFLSSGVVDEIPTPVLFIENGAWYQGTFSNIVQRLEASGRPYLRVAISGFPANGQPDEVSKHHAMDPDSLVSSLRSLIDG